MFNNVCFKNHKFVHDTTRVLRCWYWLMQCLAFFLLGNWLNIIQRQLTFLPFYMWFFVLLNGEQAHVFQSACSLSIPIMITQTNKNNNPIMRYPTHQKSSHIRYLLIEIRKYLHKNDETTNRWTKKRKWERNFSNRNYIFFLKTISFFFFSSEEQKLCSYIISMFDGEICISQATAK